MTEENRHIDYNLIGKFLSGETSDNESSEILEWIESDDKNREEFERIRKLWDESENIVPEGKALVNTDAAWFRLKERIQNDTVEDQNLQESRSTASARKGILFYLTRVAAVLFLGAIIYTFYDVFFKEPAQVQVVAESKIRETRLPDNSVVTLNENSSISYPKSFKNQERTVAMEGEAYFEVERKEDKPFIVQVPDARIEVLGTEFNVRAKQDEKEVIVTVRNGKVMLSDEENISFVILETDEKGILNRLTGHIEKQTSVVDSETFWKTRILIFRDTELIKVFETLSELYDVKITMKNELIHQCKLTAKFQDMNIEEILDKIAISFNLTITRSGDNYEISGEGC